MNHRLSIPILVIIFILCGWISTASAAVNRGLASPVSALPGDLKNVTVRDYFLPSNTREIGEIQTVMAHVVVARSDLKTAYFAASGDKVYEKDIVFTLADSKCRIRLHNKDIITIGDNSRMTLKEASEARGTTLKKSVVSMIRGKAMFYALKLFKDKGLSMSVEAPTAVVGVRGTKFGVEVTREKDKAVGAQPLLLADSSDDWGRHLIAQAGSAGGVTTTVHGFEGTVAVTSTITGATSMVTAGQSLETSTRGLGSLMPTPPEISRRFQSQTAVPPPGGASGGEQAPAIGGGQTASGDSATTQTTTEETSKTTSSSVTDTSTVAQTQTTKQEEEQQKPVPPPPTPVDPDKIPDPKINASGTNVGYFAAMLTNQTGGKLEEVFVSKNRYSGSGNVWARGTISADQDFIRVLGGGQEFSVDTQYLKYISFNKDTKRSGELTDYFISSTVLGRHTYMEWGYATIPKAFTVDGSNYIIDNRAYYIFGYNTPSLSGFSGTAAYSGNAYGSYWSPSGGEYMTGTFGCDVNYTSAALSNFSLSVSGGGASASISNASGSIGSDAHFAISGGTWNLNGVTPDQQSAAGSLYGSDAGYIGGPWGMYNSSTNTGAVGIYAGSKVTGPVAQSGYYVGMVENSSFQYVDTYITSTRQNFTTSDAYAMNLANSWSTQIDGTGSAPKKTIELGVAEKSSAWTGSMPVTFTKISSNSYLEWGTWTQPSDMLLNGTNYSFKNQGAYVWGDFTTEAQMATLKSNAPTGVYSGTAWGTMFGGNGAGTDMTGSFSAVVNFASPAISNFNVSVAGGSNSVTITNASGSFSGATSHFTISPSSGNWTINSTSATDKAAYGSVYGTGGNAIGGTWAVGGSGQHAVGGYQGVK